MNELTRMQYLDAMGIDMFVPCVRLPHSKNPTLCLLPTANEAPPEAVSVEQSVSTSSSRANDTSSANDNFGELSSSPISSASVVSNVLAVLRSEKDTVNDVPEPKQAGVLASSLEVSSLDSNDHSLEPATSPDKLASLSAKFVLGLWRVGPDLQVVDSRDEGDALPTDLLLSNVLRAHRLLPQMLPSQEILHWPLVNDGDDSWHAAHEMMMSFLEGRLLANPVTHFVLFGADAFHSVMGIDSDFQSALYQTVAVDAFAADAVVFPSLKELLHNPENKRLLWPLFQLLNTRINKIADA